MRKPSRKTATVEYLTEDTEFDPTIYKYYLGIDPSFTSTGVVLLDRDSDEPLVATHIAAGKAGDSFYKRIEILLDKLNRCVLEYLPEDILVVMEGASFSSDFNCFKLGKLSGVLEYWIASKGLNYNLVAPTYAKKVATGKGNATKDQVKLGIETRWGYSNSCDDINDAYVMAQIAKGARPLPPIPKRKSKGVPKS